MILLQGYVLCMWSPILRMSQLSCLHVLPSTATANPVPTTTIAASAAASSANRHPFPSDCQLCQRPGSVERHRTNQPCCRAWKAGLGKQIQVFGKSSCCGRVDYSSPLLHPSSSVYPAGSLFCKLLSLFAVSFPLSPECASTQ
jgi:hypothetical protein